MGERDLKQELRWQPWWLGRCAGNAGLKKMPSRFSSNGSSQNQTSKVYERNPDHIKAKIAEPCLSYAVIFNHMGFSQIFEFAITFNAGFSA